MRLLVAPARHANRVLGANTVDLVVSLVSPEAELPRRPDAVAPQLVLRFNDITAPRDGLIMPSREILAPILEVSGRAQTILIHCHAGISRSTAAAYAMACQHSGAGREADLAMALREMSPAATPNLLMVALADDLLAREGRMIAAIRAIGRGVDAYEGATIDWNL